MKANAIADTVEDWNSQKQASRNTRVLRRWISKTVKGLGRSRETKLDPTSPAVPRMPNRPTVPAVPWGRPRPFGTFDPKCRGIGCAGDAYHTSRP